MIVVMVVMLVLFMVMAAAALMVIMMMVVMFVLFVVVTAALMVIVMMVMLVLLVMVATAALVVIMMMVVMRFRIHTLQFQTCQFCRQGSSSFHSRNQLFTGQLIPGSGNQGCYIVMLANQCHTGIQLILGHRVRTGENNGGSGFDLIIIELTKVLHIDLNLACIRHGNCVTQSHFLIGHLLNCSKDIGKFTNTGRFDNHAVGVKLCNNLL